MLDELDVRYRPDGRCRIFSIKFVTAGGKLIFFPQAYACGAGRMNNKVFRVRGIQACDCLGNPEKGIERLQPVGDPKHAALPLLFPIYDVVCFIAYSRG